MKKIDLLIIDSQNDFCDPGGALYVDGADKDSIKLADFIKNNSLKLNNIYVTLDSHHNYDIAHPIYWEDERGNHPAPFTIISEDDVRKGKWRTSKKEDREHGVFYVQSLAEKGKYQLCIWPPHCLIGSWGTQIQTDVFIALNQWETDNIAMVNKIYKGSNPGTEHYGALEAEIPRKNDPLTKMRVDIVEKLKESDYVIIAGQALDYCVANTVRQLVAAMGVQNINKLVLLEDCTSSVDPTSGISEKFLKEITKKGMKLIKADSFNELI